MEGALCNECLHQGHTTSPARRDFFTISKLRAVYHPNAKGFTTANSRSDTENPTCHGDSAIKIVALLRARHSQINISVSSALLPAKDNIVFRSYSGCADKLSAK